MTRRAHARTRAPRCCASHPFREVYRPRVLSSSPVSSSLARHLCVSVVSEQGLLVEFERRLPSVLVTHFCSPILSVLLFLSSLGAAPPRAGGVSASSEQQDPRGRSAEQPSVRVAGPPPGCDEPLGPAGAVAARDEEVANRGRTAAAGGGGGAVSAVLVPALSPPTNPRIDR